MPDIYALKIPEKIDNKTYSFFLEHTSENKRKSVKKNQIKGNFTASILGEILIRYISCKYLGKKNNQLIFGDNGYGKTYLLNEPNYFYNLSHSAEMIIAAAGEKEIGVDIEKIRPINFNIAKRFFTPEEYSELMVKNEEERLEYFFKLWTVKESYIKLKGRGLVIPLDSFTAFLNKDKITEKEKSSGGCYFKSYNAEDDYIVAICSIKKDFPEKIKKINIDHLVEQFSKMI